jgi:uncharacterized membrane protein
MEEMIAECRQMMNSMNNMMGDGMMGMMGDNMMQGGMMGGSMMEGGTLTGVMTPWWILGWLLVIGAIVAMGLVVVWAFRRPGRADQPGDTPLTILKRRYAAGEIDAAQFEKMKVQIGGD